MCDSVKSFVDEAYADAERMIDENWQGVEAVAEALLKHETLSADEVSSLMRGETLDKPTVGDLLAAEAAKRPPSPPSASDGEEPELPPDAMPSPA